MTNNWEVVALTLPLLAGAGLLIAMIINQHHIAATKKPSPPASGNSSQSLSEAKEQFDAKLGIMRERRSVRRLI